jgi:Domain of unknown function (DUF4124)
MPPHPNARPLPRRLLPLLLPLALLAAPAQAEIYKWKDANGVTHYDDRPDGAPGRTVIKEPPPGPAQPPPGAAGRPPPASIAGPAPGPVTPGERAAATKISCKQELDSIEGELEKRKDMGLSSGDSAKFDQRIQARRDHYRDRCNSVEATPR